MEFAVCPACQQSVLDDDATECPFCGSSMKAKPGAKPAPKAPAAAAKPSAKPAAAKASSAGDDPFDSGSNISTTAVPASLKPSKGRALKVVCPMCETTGYVPESAAGSEVKCANSKCLVPVFRAPAIEPEKPAPPPPKRKGNPLVAGLITLVVVSAIGGGIYMIALRPTNEAKSDKVLTPEDLKLMAANRRASPQENPSTPVKPVEKTIPTTDTVPKPTVDLMPAILKDAKEVVLVTGRQNRSKPYCRRLSSETYSFAGEVTGAKEQLAGLQSVGGELPYFQIGPLVEIFWLEQRLNNTAGADAALEQALAQAKSLPKRGRDQLDLATRLGTALVSAGRIDDAQTMILEHLSSDVDGTTSANLSWIANDPRSRHLDRVFGLEPVSAGGLAQPAAVAAAATFRGASDNALKFAAKWTAPEGHAEVLAGWASAQAWLSGDPAVANTISTAAGKLPPAAGAYVLARASRFARAAENQDVARQLSQQAHALLANVETPSPYQTPTLSALVKSRPVFDTEWLLAASAAAEVAVAQQELGGDAATISKALESALSYLRATGPTVPSITVLLNDLNQSSPTTLRAKFKQELGIKTDDDARQAITVYRRALQDLEAAANNRFAAQVRVLSHAVAAGLETTVWTIVSDRSHAAKAEDQELYLSSELTNLLADRFRTTQQTDSLKALEAAVGASGLPEPLTNAFRSQVATGNLGAAWASLNVAGNSTDVREAEFLRAVILTAAAMPMEETWKLIGPCTEVVLKEQAIEWAAWIAARKSPQEGAWSHRPQLSSATEILSLCRGTAAGIADSKQVAK